MVIIRVPLNDGELARKYIVGTFWTEGDRRPRAYTYQYNRAWSGCVEYEVHASSGTSAKKAAIKARKEDKKQ